MTIRWELYIPARTLDTKTELWLRETCDSLMGGSSAAPATTPTTILMETSSESSRVSCVKPVTIIEIQSSYTVLCHFNR